jgi:hypothetical protein
MNFPSQKEAVYVFHSLNGNVHVGPSIGHVTLTGQATPAYMAAQLCYSVV